MLDRLLGTRDLGTDLVVAPLHGRELVGLRGVLGARALDRGLERALTGKRGLQGEIALAHDRGPRTGFGLDLAQAQRQELRLQLALLLLERLVTARGGRLALQVAELLLDLLTQVSQALEILACVTDARLGLAATLLVAGDARPPPRGNRACLRAAPR